ncbi:MAG: hypothetical protein FRX49_11032 [Trebouxia sp. A1-2]|nr:MAG: hypothetical protein FRX49_11032 [Trebouxia sp. A1-2]
MQPEDTMKRIKTVTVTVVMQLCRSYHDCDRNNDVDRFEHVHQIVYIGSLESSPAGRGAKHQLYFQQVWSGQDEGGKGYQEDFPEEGHKLGQGCPPAIVLAKGLTGAVSVCLLQGKNDVNPDGQGGPGRVPQVRPVLLLKVHHHQPYLTTVLHDAQSDLPQASDTSDTMAPGPG